MFLAELREGFPPVFSTVVNAVCLWIFAVLSVNCGGKSLDLRLSVSFVLKRIELASLREIVGEDHGLL